jgi:serine/threonine-protein kinase
MIGQLVGNYKIVEKLGEGAMGTVYKGIDVMIEREVAIKVLRPEIASRTDVVERFRSEAATLARLNHPSIATLYSFFRQGEQYFMVMEYVPGETLEQCLKRRGQLTAEYAIPVFCHVLDGIDHAHRLGILHRDLKPGNIMLTPQGGAKVMDFGIARVLGTSRMTREGNIIGTLEYIAPERIKGQEADLRSDIYSLGAVLFEMLTGRLPFEADTDYALMEAHVKKSLPSFSEIGAQAPASLQSAIAKAMAKDPGRRFSSALEFRGALLESLSPVPIPAEKKDKKRSPKPTRLAAMGGQFPHPSTGSAGSITSILRGIHAKYYLAASIALLVVAGVLVYAVLWNSKPRTTLVVPSPPPAPGKTVTDSQQVIDQEPIVSDGKDAVSTEPTPTAKAKSLKPSSSTKSDAEKRREALRALGLPDDEEQRRAQAKKALEQ